MSCARQQAGGSRPVGPQSGTVRVFVFVAVSAFFGGLIFNGITAGPPKVFEDQLWAAQSRRRLYGFRPLIANPAIRRS